MRMVGWGGNSGRVGEGGRVEGWKGGRVEGWKGGRGFKFGGLVWRFDWDGFRLG